MLAFHPAITLAAFLLAWGEHRGTGLGSGQTQAA